MQVNRIHKPYLCRMCGNATGIKICKCQKAYYCSRNCQKVDWREHKSDCYTLVDHPNSNKQTINSSIASNSFSSSPLLCPKQQQISESTAPPHVYQQHTQWAREGRPYDPTLLQYQQAKSSETNTATTSTIEDFEENLFNSLMYSVDESTEKEILKNLNIRDEELLATSLNLVSDSSATLDDQTLREYQPVAQPVEQIFDARVFEQIRRQQSFESKPETQQLLKETRDNLEKELSLFRKINLHEPQQRLDEEDSSNGSDNMQTSNPKYINHARLDDHLLYK